MLVLITANVVQRITHLAAYLARSKMLLDGTTATFDGHVCIRIK